MSLLTADRLHEVLDYDAERGEFRWRESTTTTGRRRSRSGRRAGWVEPSGYVRITIDGQAYLAHRLAWLYVKGSWPTGELDHRNGDPGDFRIANLREATRSENMQNLHGAHRDSRTGRLGVHYKRRCGLFAASIMVDGVTRHLGYFRTAEAAETEYLKAKTTLHPFGGH